MSDDIPYALVDCLRAEATSAIMQDYERYRGRQEAHRMT